MGETSSRSLWDRLFGVFLVVVFVAMAVELVLLIRQNRELKAVVASLQQMPAAGTGQAPPALLEGETVEALELPSVAGGRERVSYDDPGPNTVLCIFSPHCPACRENMESWKLLHETHASADTRFYYISTVEEETTREYAEEHQLPGPVLLADQESLLGYKVSRIPTTVVVGPGGVVKKVWVGQVPEDASAQL